ncbi:MAG: DNA replication/repair protein RecF [Clostridia bacterium]|nr:DNA replication/repair protein RecF [Clostridia bacterium]
MQVKSLRCVLFRNLGDVLIEPDSGMNVICGENAQGKTNLLEALWLFTGAKSFRNAKDSAFLQLGQQKGRTELLFTSGGVEYSAKMEFDEKRTAYLNDKALQNPSKLAGTFNAVVFSPNDLSLVKDGPSGRRRFLDLAVGQLYPNYIGVLRNYTRAVTQRNQIIKDFRYDGSLAVMLDVFEEEIAKNGAKIVEWRKRYLASLQNYIPEIYAGISSGREKIGMEYETTGEPEDLLQMLKNARKEDMYSGVTSFGPHRDDILFSVDGLSARSYASQGQKRSISLSVKLAQAEVIRQVVGEYPVCLLDDVMSELDPARQNYILNHIRDWQSFLTCCDPSDFAGLSGGKIFRVEKGQVQG